MILTSHETTEDLALPRSAPSTWNRAVQAAEAYGQALDNGTPEEMEAARRSAIQAGCTDPDERLPGRPDKSGNPRTPAP